MKIAIASGKGGTGKTFVSTNLYRSLKKRAKEVVLIDCDAEVPNSSLFFSKKVKQHWKVEDFRPKLDASKCTYCEQCVEYCEFNAFICIPEAKHIQFMPELCHGCTACTIACKSQALTPSSIQIGETTAFELEDGGLLYEGKLGVHHAAASPVIHHVIDKALSHQQAEFYLMDAPPGTSCSFIQTCNLADYVLLVTEPTPFGMSDLIQAMQTLDSLGKEYGVVINRSDMGDDQLRNYLQEKEVTIVAEIPFKRSVASCYAEGQLVVDSTDEENAVVRNHFDSMVTFLSHLKPAEK